MRLVLDKYKIKDLADKRPSGSRLRVKNYTPNNIHEIKSTKIYTAIGGPEMNKLHTLHAIGYDKLKKSIGNVMENI